MQIILKFYLLPLPTRSNIYKNRLKQIWGCPDTNCAYYCIVPSANNVQYRKMIKDVRNIYVKDNGGKPSTYSGTNNIATNSKVYMPPQAIVTKRPLRPQTEGAQQRGNNYPSTQDLVDKDNATYGNSFPEGSFGVGSLASPSRLISKDNNAYGNTFPEGSFGIGSNVSLGRQIGVQLNKDQATYGNSVPSGSFGISNKGKQDSARNKAHKRDQERNSRRGSAAKNKGWWPF